MKKNRENQKGFATIFVLLLSSALMIMLAMAMKVGYRLHKYNKKELKQVQARADKLVVSRKE